MIHAVTTFVSAFLLFQVEPMIAKLLLPFFGGSAAVWITCLLFFQVALLGGYLYAHAALRWLPRRTQLLVHAALIAVSCVVLPVAPSSAWRLAATDDPALRLLALLTVTLGLPYVVLSATTPLVQSWFVRDDAARPYRLFAISNVGSLVALLSYPLVVEPLVPNHVQARVWTVGYLVFAALCVATMLASRHAAAAPAPSADDLGPRRRPIALWVLLAACGSALLSAVTNHITQNVAAVPILWVLPLALYLASFILAFARDYPRWLFVPLLAPALGGMAYLRYADGGNASYGWAIPAFALGLFVACVVCHGELARRRPPVRDLSVFYLATAFGGALGSSFVAVVAPRVFATYRELPLSLLGCAVLATVALRDVALPLRAALALGSVGLAVYLGVHDLGAPAGVVLQRRNFYGALAIHDDAPGTKDAERMLVHGTIDHGVQLLDPARRCVATSYYGEHSGVGRAIRVLQRRGRLRLGLIGLGAGVLASYGRDGDELTFYELNPLVPELATTRFTFLSGCPGEKRILLGDARLTLEAQAPQRYDLIVVDAFSGDAIPIQLLTREAIELYVRHLAPDGVLALHISNRYVDLEPIAARAAQVVGAPGIVVGDEGEEARYLSASNWVLISRDRDLRGSDELQSSDHHVASDRGVRAWTDDRSNLLETIVLP